MPNFGRWTCIYIYIRIYKFPTQMIVFGEDQSFEGLRTSRVYIYIYSHYNSIINLEPLEIKSKVFNKAWSFESQMQNTIQTKPLSTTTITCMSPHFQNYAHLMILMLTCRKQTLMYYMSLHDSSPDSWDFPRRFPCGQHCFWCSNPDFPVFHGPVGTGSNLPFWNLRLRNVATIRVG